MTKTELIVRQFAKTNKKNFENYMVTGIVHRLADPEVKFVTQQYEVRVDVAAARAQSRYLHASDGDV